ncbi:MAG: formylglycine-generating enzyme family protein [Phycisphaerae bacterium]|jgi:formylglycine-generating enzyme required for sulfatase activity|nr:formylglycine-generating enzyme family protein [Phycisphaerae bacterium]
MTPAIRLRLAAALTVFAIALTGGVVLADAASDFETLFGDEAKRIAATRTKTDDVKFAAALLKAAKEMPDSPALQILLYEKTSQFASSGLTGFDTAMEALGLLEKAVPAKKTQWLEKKLEVVKFRFDKSYGMARKTTGGPYMEMLEAMADAHVAKGEGTQAKALYYRARSIATYIKSPRAAEIIAKSKRAGAMALQQVKIKSLHTKLARDAQDTAVRKELINLYVIAMDQPAEAAKLLTDDLDEVTRTYIPLATKKLDGLDEAICLELGDWYYLKLSKNALARGKPAPLQRAAGYYRKFLKDHTRKDAQTYRVKAALTKIEKDLEKLGASVDGPSFGKTITLDLGNSVMMKLVQIPAGKFMMGSPKTEIGHEENEGPQRLVTISKPFFMGINEVTQAQYQAVVGENPSRFKAPRNPVEMVTWADAMAFCKALSKKTGRAVRLPTEAQWEYACRAGSKTRFSFGNDEKDLTAYAWCRINSDKRTHPVSGKQGNSQTNIAKLKQDLLELEDELKAAYKARGKHVKRRVSEAKERIMLLLAGAPGPEAVKLRKRLVESRRTEAAVLRKEVAVMMRKDTKSRAWAARIREKQAQYKVLVQEADELDGVGKGAMVLKKPNAFGLYDMHGNVWEWCLDLYDPKFYAKGKKIDPVNISAAPKGKYHVTRGGSWGRDPVYCNSAHRGFGYAYAKHFTDFGGFRVIVTSK